MTVYLDDKKLVKQILEGNEQAFECFFEDNFARLYRFALARLSDDPEAAREIAQITLTRALRKLHTYRAGTNNQHINCFRHSNTLFFGITAWS